MKSTFAKMQKCTTFGWFIFPLQHQFHSVVVITFALHAKGRRFEPGWNYVLLGPPVNQVSMLRYLHWRYTSRVKTPFFVMETSYYRHSRPIWKSCIVGESNPGLPRGRREFYHWTNNAWELVSLLKTRSPMYSIYLQVKVPLFESVAYIMYLAYFE